MSFPKFVTVTKNTPFFTILHVFAPLNDVHAYIAWTLKKNPKNLDESFYEDDIQLQIQVSPPPRDWIYSQLQIHTMLYVAWLHIHEYMHKIYHEVKFTKTTR